MEKGRVIVEIVVLDQGDIGDRTYYRIGTIKQNKQLARYLEERSEYVPFPGILRIILSGGGL